MQSVFKKRYACPLKPSLSGVVMDWHKDFELTQGPEYHCYTEFCFCLLFYSIQSLYHCHIHIVGHGVTSIHSLSRELVRASSLWQWSNTEDRPSTCAVTEISQIRLLWLISVLHLLDNSLRTTYSCKPAKYTLCHTTRHLTPQSRQAALTKDKLRMSNGTASATPSACVAHCHRKICSEFVISSLLQSEQCMLVLLPAQARS